MFCLTPMDDKGAFQDLVEPHLKLLWQTAYRFTGCREDADDLLQELLVRLYPQRERLSKVERLRPWLVRSLYHLFVDSRRGWLRNVLSLVAPDSTDAVTTMSAETPGPDALADADQVSRALFRALARIDADQRAVVVLHDMEGYTLAELHGTLEVPIGTLKSRLFRGRRRLRQLLGGNLSGADDV